MSIDNKKYLGWGIVGTPSGRQQVGYGADRQLNLAKNFDLPQEFGSCLIDPRQKKSDEPPLYRLSYFTENKNSVLGIATYYSIFEQGQTRSGSYFGAFIETVNNQISETTVYPLFSVLWELSIYQYNHFIDEKKQAYIQSINGVEIQLPHIQKELDEIVQGFKPLVPNYLTQTLQKGDLYIHCQSQEEVVRTLILLLRMGIFYRYKNIFFSASQHISAQIQSKRVEKMFFQQLQEIEIKDLPWVQEIKHLRFLAKKLEGDRKESEKEVKRLKDDQEKIIEEKDIEHQKSIKFYKEKVAEAEAKAKNTNNYTDLGRKVFELCKNTQVNSELTRKEKPDPIERKLDELLKQQNSLLDENRKAVKLEMQQQESPQKSSDILTWIFCILSAVLLSIFMWNVCFNEIISKEDYNNFKELEGEKKKLETKKEELEGEKKKLETKKEELESEKKDLEEKYKELCKSVPQCKKKMEKK